MAPIAPGALAESASAKMRFLYSAEYWRRLALTTTSGSGIVLASPGATLSSASLRSASLRSAPGEAKTPEGGGTPFTDFFMSISFSALYTKSRKGRRLTDLGTEGMIQVMEAWIVADPDAVEAHYGQHFLKNALPRAENLESIVKQRIYDAMKHATAKTQKGEYHKIGHAAALLEMIDPAKVRRRCPSCNRLFATLTERIDRA